MPYQKLIERLEEIEKHIMHRPLGSRVWDALTKLLVPVSIIIGGALITHEVRLSKIEQSVNGNKEAIRAAAPGYIQNSIEEIKRGVQAMETRLYGLNDRLIRIETKIEKLDDSKP